MAPRRFHSIFFVGCSPLLSSHQAPAAPADEMVQEGGLSFEDQEGSGEDGNEPEIHSFLVK